MSVRALPSGRGGTRWHALRYALKLYMFTVILASHASLSARNVRLTASLARGSVKVLCCREECGSGVDR